MNWNEPAQKPNHGARVVALHNRGKSATIGRYGRGEWTDDPCVVCDQTSHDIWWDDVTAWIPAPGEVDELREKLQAERAFLIAIHTKMMSIATVQDWEECEFVIEEITAHIAEETD